MAKRKCIRMKQRGLVWRNSKQLTHGQPRPLVRTSRLIGNSLVRGDNGAVKAADRC